MKRSREEADIPDPVAAALPAVRSAPGPSFCAGSLPPTASNLPEPSDPAPAASALEGEEAERSRENKKKPASVPESVSLVDRLVAYTFEFPGGSYSFHYYAPDSSLSDAEFALFLKEDLFLVVRDLEYRLQQALDRPSSTSSLSPFSSDRNDSDMEEDAHVPPHVRAGPTAAAAATAAVAAAAARIESSSRNGSGSAFTEEDIFVKCRLPIGQMLCQNKLISSYITAHFDGQWSVVVDGDFSSYFISNPSRCLLEGKF